MTAYPSTQTVETSPVAPPAPHGAVLTHGHVQLAGPLERRVIVVDEVLHLSWNVVFRGHDATGEAVRCVAGRLIMRPPLPGETWAVTGTWQAYKAMGPQLRVLKAALERPSGRLFVQAIARHATAFPGVGHALAQRVWDAHGECVYDMLDEGQAEAFIPQVGARLADVLVDGWKEIDGEAKAYRWLERHAFPAALAARVVAIYGAMPVPDEHGPEAASVGPVAWHLTEDPYRMLAFAPWARVDEAARKMGVSLSDDRRLVGAAEAVCVRHLASGHTWVRAADLQAESASLLRLEGRAVARGVARAVERGVIVALADGFQLPGAHLMEAYVQRRLAAILGGRDAPAQSRLKPSVDVDTVEAMLDDFERIETFTLTPEQRGAVWTAVSEPFSLLLGGPGVGKTTVLKAVHHVASVMRPVHQAALAGRAAQRMAEATGRPASTIAALTLALERGEVSFEDEPLLIIDEASMCDLATLYRLLRRCPPGLRLLLVGDPGQLSPIGFGLVLHVVASGLALDGSGNRVPQAWLTRVLRQTDASGIPRVCGSIRNGQVPSLRAGTAQALADLTTVEGLWFVDVAPDEVTDAIVEIMSGTAGEQRPQVIGSVKAGPGGIDEINTTLRSIHAAGSEPLAGGFCVGDPLLVTRNDRELGVMNGDLGTVLGSAGEGALRCRFGTSEKVLSALALERAELGYAITCHKAQGSQFPTIIVPVTPTRLLDRTLLLTAVSRAERAVVLVGDRQSFDAAVVAPPRSDHRRVGLGLACVVAESSGDH